MTRRALARLVLLPCALALGGCYLAAGLGDFVPAGEGGEGATAKATTGAKASASSGETVGTGGAPPGCDHVVITEIRAASGDFVELFNPTADVVYLEGWQLDGLQADGDPQIKWTGKPEHALQPGAYFILGVEGVTDRDANLTGFATPGVTVARLVKQSGERVDAVCVCDEPGCTRPGFEGECARALVAPAFSSQSAQSAQRRGTCADTDDSSADFAAACPTPRAALTTSTPPCP